jgi:hypothetical protein
LPGTRFYDDLAAKDRILANNYPQDWCNYRFTRMLFKPHKMTIDEVYSGFHEFRKNFYSVPVKLKRYFSTLIATKRISTALVSYLMNRSYEKAFRNSEMYPIMENRQ